MSGKLNDFIIPKLNRKFLIRVGIVIIACFVFFGFICRPMYIKGSSMEPTYSSTGFTFCWRPAYWFSKPERGDIVIIRYSGKKHYLKRVIGLPGDTIEFRKGKLILNGKELAEPYVKNPCDWNLPERTVEEGRIYVIGDNRSMMLEQHNFGAVKQKRIYGRPLW